MKVTLYHFSSYDNSMSSFGDSSRVSVTRSIYKLESCNCKYNCHVFGEHNCTVAVSSSFVTLGIVMLSLGTLFTNFIEYGTLTKCTSPSRPPASLCNRNHQHHAVS